MSIESLYNSRISLYRNSLDSTTPDSIGGISRTVSLVKANMACYYTPLSFKEAIFFGKLNIQSTHRFFTSCGCEVRTTDLIFADGLWYNIQYAENAGGNRSHHLEILCTVTKSPRITYPESSSSDSSSSSSSSTSSSSSSESSSSSSSSGSSLSSSSSSLDSDSSSSSSYDSSSSSSTSQSSNSSSSSIDSSSSTSSSSSSYGPLVAESLTINTGSINSGTLADTYTDNGVLLVLNEVNQPAPAFDYVFNFTYMPPWVSQCRVRGWYKGNPSHRVKLRYYNWGTGVYDNATASTTDFPNTTSEQYYQFALNPATYRDSNGRIRVKIIHTTNGAANHYFRIDQLILY